MPNPTQPMNEEELDSVLMHIMSTGKMPMNLGHTQSQPNAKEDNDAKN